MQKTIPLKPKKDAEAQTSATADHQTHRTIEIQTEGAAYKDFSQHDDMNNLEINTVLQGNNHGINKIKTTMSQPSVKNNILDWHYQTIQLAMGGPRDVNEIITTIEQPIYP